MGSDFHMHKSQQIERLDDRKEVRVSTRSVASGSSKASVGSQKTGKRFVARLREKFNTQIVKSRPTRMKLNEHVALLHPRILLVPYSAHHVPTYHEWMKDPALQHATASEPLSLDQEYSMQKSWREDYDKLTFIACRGLSLREGENVIKGGDKSGCADEPKTMIGDVNLFVTEEVVDDEDSGEDDGPGCVGEVEIMIARTDMRGNGLGTSVLLTFLWYILTNLEAIVREYSQAHGGKMRTMKYLRVKIDADNQRSIHVFEKCGFRKTTEEPNFFHELELRFRIPTRRGGKEIADMLDIDPPRALLYTLV